MRASNPLCAGIVARGFLAVAATGLLLSGCTEKPPKPAERYVNLGPRDVPKYLEDTIYQYTDISGIDPFPISGYGLVTHLHGTGGSRVSTPVRAMMAKVLEQHDIGSFGSGWGSPEQILNSKDCAIVRVDGWIPPGARAGTDWCTWFDAQVSIPQESDATSLAHGVLFQCDLKENGATLVDPGDTVRLMGQAGGEVFINPQYALDSTIDTPAANLSRKTGMVLAGARVIEDRPLILRLRAPGTRMARSIERRIVESFEGVVDDDLRAAAGADGASEKKVANAQDEAVIYLYVPKIYAGNWQHFAGVARHLFMKGADPKFAAIKARELADEAVKKDAQLMDISYCWEGLGKPALFAVGPLMSSDQPDVQFAAARAAVFLGDTAAVNVLLDIAEKKGDPYRVNAVQTLAELPATPRVDRLCRSLLDSDEALVRIEAYKLLVKHNDDSVFSRWIKDGKREVFALDLIRSSGPPMVYASRQGVPRVAVFGMQTELDTPLIFSAMDSRLTISSSEHDQSRITVFYRGQELAKPVSLDIAPSLPELVRVLAGDSESDFSVHGLHFGYADVVAVLQSLVDQQRVSGMAGQQRLLASFVLQEPGQVQVPSDTRPLMRDGGSRPQSDKPGQNDNPQDHLLRESSAVGAGGGRPAN